MQCIEYLKFVTKFQICHHKIVSFNPKFRWQGRRLRIQQLQQLQQQVQCGQGCLLLLQDDRGHGGVDDGGVEDGDHGVGRDVEADFFALGPLLCPEIQEKVKGPDLVSAKELCRLFHSEVMLLQRLQESSKEQVASKVSWSAFLLKVVLCNPEADSPC